MNAFTLVRNGLKNPIKVPPYLLGRLLPNSRWGPEWKREDGFITFTDGGFAGGSPTRPELSARIYYEVAELDRLLAGREFGRSLEIGCGYGRMSGWIANHADHPVAIEPNAEALAQAETLYPEIDFYEAVANDLPFPDDSFDLVVSWAVLTHVPPGTFEECVAEIDRVLTDDGTILLCEQTAGHDGVANWPRDRSEYESRFDSLALVDTGERGAEPTFSHGELMETMLFERP